MPVNTSLPQNPNVPFLNPDGSVSTIWLSFLNSLSSSTNSSNGFLNQVNSPSNPANRFFATPSNQAGAAAFRQLASADLEPIAGQYPATATNDNAATGDIGEYLSATLPVGSAISLSSVTPADVVTLVLSPGDWDIWGSIGTTVSGANITILNAWLSTKSATDPGPPNNGAYFQYASTVTGAGVTQTTGPISVPVGSMRLSIAQQTTVYLSVLATFSGTVNGYGFIGARRRR